MYLLFFTKTSLSFSSHVPSHSKFSLVAYILLSFYFPRLSLLILSFFSLMSSCISFRLKWISYKIVPRFSFCLYQNSSKLYNLIASLQNIIYFCILLFKLDWIYCTIYALFLSCFSGISSTLYNFIKRSHMWSMTTLHLSCVTFFFSISDFF